MTVAMLMNNTVLSSIRAAKKLISMNWDFKPLQLNVLRPVPTYIFSQCSCLYADIHKFRILVISRYPDRKSQKISCDLPKKLV